MSELIGVAEGIALGYSSHNFVEEIDIMPVGCPKDKDIEAGG